LSPDTERSFRNCERQPRVKRRYSTVWVMRSVAGNTACVIGSCAFGMTFHPPGTAPIQYSRVAAPAEAGAASVSTASRRSRRRITG
jgi:hypothetical protein